MNNKEMINSLGARREVNNKEIINEVGALGSRATQENNKITIIIIIVVIIITRVPSCILHERGTLHASPSHRRLRYCSLCSSPRRRSEISKMRNLTSSEATAISVQSPSKLQDWSSMSSRCALHHLTLSHF